MKNKNTGLNIIMYVLIGLIVLVGIVFFIPENKETPVTNKEEKKEEVVITFTTNDTNVTLKKGETKEINYNLSGNYNINWFSSNNSVATISNGVITAVGSGTCNVTGTVSVDGTVKSISIKVTVEEEKKEEPKEDPAPSKKKIEKLVISTNKLSVVVGESKKITYRIEPEDGEIISVKWESSDPSIATVTDGTVTGIKEGTATVTLNINDILIGKITIKVSPKVSNLIIDTYPRNVLKVGETTKVIAHVTPEKSNSITYKSSNDSVATVNNGVITAKSKGTATITLTAGSKTSTISISVLPNKGVINGSNNIWGYKSKNIKSHNRADASFFQKMASSGRGTLSGNTYTISSGSTKFTYYIDRSLLDISGYKVMVRMYYPNDKDLSTTNMLTYMGGDGEKNFSGIFGEIEKDRSIINNTDAIFVLVAEGNNTAFDQKAGMYSTQFAQAVVGHKSGKNSIIGFSTGGTKVMGAANLYHYDRVIVFSSYYNWATSAENVKNCEVMFYIPNGDHLYQQAKTTLNDMKKSGYKNVTVLTNSQELMNLFGNDFLVINPGSSMTNAHVTKNVTDSNMFAYVND